MSETETGIAGDAEQERRERESQRRGPDAA
jgi:hypothetical protein